LNFDEKAFAWGNLDSAALNTTVNGKNHYLYADPKASARSAKTWTIGTNWYLNPEVKFSLNYSQTSFNGGGGLLQSGNGVSPNNSTFYDLVTQNQVKDREDERVLLARFQVAF